MKKFVPLIAILLALALLCSCAAPQMDSIEEESVKTSKTKDKKERGEKDDVVIDANPLRVQFLQFTPYEQITPSVAPYSTDASLSNIVNADQFYFSDADKELLAQNLFLVRDRYGWDEFFEVYESNRYGYTPSFVTVDSLMHTYHLYFSLLLNHTEKTYLADRLKTLTDQMQAASCLQYEELAGSQWEEAAARNVAFFTVAGCLLDDTFTAPEYAEPLVTEELAKIKSQSGIDVCGITDDYMDYSQFTPRGFYEGNVQLEQYFRAMMWYGQVNFFQKEDTLSRSALLMTIAMATDGKEAWEEIYSVTAFFAGVSDDLSYYEYLPAILDAYGTLPDSRELMQNTTAYAEFFKALEDMPLPAINSVPVEDSVENVEEYVKGFRFMGQRFSVDAAVMQQLVYSKVQKASDGDCRMLPDALDFPAALGSNVALDILKSQGVEKYPNYMEQMAKMRDVVSSAPETSWASSLSSAWLYTLNPLLEEKGAGYPSFMQSEQWQKKALETYCGSYTELKHDTVLYAKQLMAEMGGDGPDERDDRGYVEPEVVVYQRFCDLAQQTMEGLDRYSMLADADRESLTILYTLAQNLLTISKKELQNQPLTDDEYELIRCYGGTLEHFWEEAAKEISGEEYISVQQFPAKLVVDIATDPNGSVLELATGDVSSIYVVFSIDGELHIARGAVYSFYQFTQPISQRLTDSQWRELWYDELPEKPAWTDSYSSRN